MSNILTGFNMQGNDPIDNRIVSPSKFETLEEYLQRVPIQKRYYGLSFYALDENNELRHYTFQTSLIEPTIDDDEEEIERLDKELQEHVKNKEIHKTSEEIRSEIVDADIPDTIARVQWTLDKIEEAVNTVMGDIVDGASDEYNTLKKIQDKIVELRTEVESQLYGDDGGEVLKTLEQALKFLNQYKDFIVDIPDNYVNKQDIVDNLNTDDPTKVLSARQGKVLSETLTNYFDSAMASIRAETNRAINAENRIETKLDKEIDRSIKEDQRIDAKLDAEIKRSTDEDLRIDSKLDAEIERSTNEDIRIDNKLDSEINRSTAEDDRLDQKIDAETNRATNAENRIEAKLDDEIDRSTAEDIRIQSELDAEEARAQSEEKRIEDKLDAEIERSTTKDTELGNQIIAETNRAEGEEQRIETKLDNEITRSTAKDEEHDDRIKALEGDTHVQNTDVGTTSQTFQLQLGKPGNKIKNEDAAISVRNADDSDYVNFIAKNATFKGDLLVEGQSFVTEAETVEIKDNLLLLNKGEVGAGVTKGIAGLEIDRGTEPNYQIIFDESDNRFKAGEIGDIQCLALRDDDGNMLDGMFTTWDSATHRLKTTNIIPNTRKLFFNDNTNSLEYTYQTYEENTYGNDSFTFTTASGSLYISAGNNNLNLGTDKTYFRFYKNLFIPSSIISSGTSISLLNASGATIATFGSPSTINSSLNVANQVIIKGGSNTKLILQSSDADNFNLIESQNSSGTILSKLGYYGTFWGIDNKKIATEEFANNKFLPLAGGTMTGVILMNNNVVIQSKNSSGTAKRLIGKGSDNVTYIGDTDGHMYLYSDATDIIHIRNGTSYRIWDSYNLTNPVTYTTDTYNYATLRNKDGQYFTYIKAGTSGLLPHSKATLVSGGSGFLGTSDQSFNAAYINNLYTNKVTFGDAGSFIDNKSGDSDHKGIGFYTPQNGACPVYVGSLCVSDSYANGAPNIPTNGIYSKGIIYIENGIGFRNSIWTNDLTPNRNYSGYLQVLDAYDAANAGGPTNYGTVLQVNSKKNHWANQLWFSGGAEASKKGLYYRHMAYNQTEYGEWNRLLTNKDVNIIQRQSSSNPSTLPVNQIFYSEIQKVTGTPTDQGALFSVQGDDEGIQLWASSSRNKLYYRTKWTSFGNWIKLVTEFDLNSYLTKTEASTLYYPYNGRGYLSITSTGRPVMSNNQGYAVKDKDGNEREVLWMGPNNALYLGNTFQYTLGQLDLRCTTLTHNDNKIATQNYVTNQLSNYLPLTGGTLSGNLTINTVGSTTFVINNNDTNGSETFMRVLRKGTASAAIGFRDSLGAYIYNYNSKKYLFIDNDGYARVGTTSGSTRLALITDIPSISGYLPLSGGTMSGNISFNGDTGHIVVGARETSNYVSAVSFNKGSATNSALIGYHLTGGSDSSGALILVPYSTSADPWAKTVGLYIAKNELLLDGKAIATQEYVTWNNVAGKPTIYERTIGINGTYWSFYAPTNATSAMIYGPTSAGTSGQILQSTGGVPEWVNASSVVGNFVSKSGDTMTGALTMRSRRNNIVVDVVGGDGHFWDEGAGALSIQVPNDSGQTPLILARRSGAAINTTVATERLLSMELLDTGHSFIIGMSGSEALQLDWTSGKAGTGKLFGKQIATTDQIPSIPSISISNSGSGNAVTAISASGHTLTVTKGATYLTSSSLSGYATQSWANSQFASLSLYNTTRGYSTIRTTGNEVCLGNTAATSASNTMLVNYRIPSGCTYAPASWVWRAGSSSSYAAGYWGNLYMNNNLVATQSWVNSQGFIKSVTGYLPLTGGTMSGSITIPGNSGTLVITANETSNYVRGVSFTKGSTVNSAVFGYHSTGGDGTGSIVISPYPTSASPWDGDIGLFITKGSVKIDNVPLATQTWVNSQGFLKTAPSITISNSGSGNAVTAITASVIPS